MNGDLVLESNYGEFEVVFCLGGERFGLEQPVRVDEHEDFDSTEWRYQNCSNLCVRVSHAVFEADTLASEIMRSTLADRRVSARL